MIIIISLFAVTSTLLGGMFAMRFKDKLHLVLGFSAGAILGVAFFDLLPEAIELRGSTTSISALTTTMALGFLAYMLLDRFIVLHDHSHDEHSHTNKRGVLGAGSLALHSFLDGAAIGLAFKVSPSIGAIVATAVLVHDFSDGINTVNLILKNNGSRTDAFKWLVIDAVAPALGALATLFFSLPASVLAFVLAIFCGFFLYIGASDLLPESHHAHPTRWTTLATIIGAAVLYVAIRIAG